MQSTYRLPAANHRHRESPTFTENTRKRTTAIRQFSSRHQVVETFSPRPSSLTMPRSWSIASRNQVTEPHRPSPASQSTRFRSSDKSIDLKKLLEVYDDYPVVLHSLERTSDALQRAEEDARVAEDKKEQTEEDLKHEKEEREKDRKQAEKDQKDAVKKMEDKVRAELNPKIKDLEDKLKKMTTDRDTQKRELGELRNQMSGWISSMDKLHKERQAGEEKEAKAAEERKKLAEKLKTLDNDILQGLKKAAEKAEYKPAPAPAPSIRNAPSRAGTESRQTFRTGVDNMSVAPARTGAESRQTVRTGADNRSVAPTISRVNSHATTVREGDRR